MPKVAREKPKKLHIKLAQIRKSLKLSQSEMLKVLGLEDGKYRSVISGYELGTKEPNLITILKYAKLVNVSTDYLLDDELELPKNFQKA